MHVSPPFFIIFEEKIINSIFKVSSIMQKKFISINYVDYAKINEKELKWQENICCFLATVLCTSLKGKKKEKYIICLYFYHQYVVTGNTDMNCGTQQLLHDREIKVMFQFFRESEILFSCRNKK